MIEWSKEKCHECKITLSEYERTEYHGLCLDCYTNMFREEEEENE